MGIKRRVQAERKIVSVCSEVDKYKGIARKRERQRFTKSDAWSASQVYLSLVLWLQSRWSGFYIL